MSVKTENPEKVRHPQFWRRLVGISKRSNSDVDDGDRLCEKATMTMGKVLEHASL